MNGIVAAVSNGSRHALAKGNLPAIRLRAGYGVEGDAHAGATVQHRSRVARDPNQPNLRQVRLIHPELHDELRASDFDVAPGQMGENITTRGLDLLGLPTGALLKLGQAALIQVTGLRNPCRQLEGIQQGLMAAVLGRGPDGNLAPQAGVMGVVIAGGAVRPGDGIEAFLPAGPRQAQLPV